ncbi:hypothetical protein ALI144C_11715 [Actinosynnema sp. ALI-1.44]|nr:hypothetical protein ALI144C_11715 [Actinosynnema sp. ALI-1.44]
MFIAILAGQHPAVATGYPQVDARVETPGLFDDAEGGNADADDPAIWVNERDPSRSIVFATASSQGDNTFAAYDLPGRYRTSFQVKYGNDLVQESDGAAVIDTGLGPRSPHGLLVVQDGDNSGEPRDSTNFKFVRWDDVSHAIR